MKRALILLILFGLPCGAASASFVTVADWQFNGTDWLADSSGNGYNLTNYGLSQGGGGTTLVCNGGGLVIALGSDGAMGGGVDLTSYRKVRISWRVISGMTTTGIMWEHGYTTGTPGDLMADVNEYSQYGGPGYTPLDPSSGIGCAALNNTNQDQLPLADGVWTEITIQYDLDAATGADVVRVWINGIEQPDSDTGFTGHNIPGEGYSFLNADFNIGARDWGAPFTGEIDWLTVEGYVVPEPATCALVGFGSLFMLVRRRR